ncbi:sugar transferase [Streptococcus tangpeifui]|uniref:sugar transferase n=1 Tax=Streptococcus tangpeifui TaxID=2709400 RepID=UPI0013E9A119|nr:sugar transferase [Streptococcus sp. ZJ373]
MFNGRTYKHKVQTSIYSRFIKRLLDILVGLVGTVVFFVPLALIIAVFYLFGKDRGPIIFRQERMGLHGKSFKIMKFRSMVVNAEELLERDEKLYQTYVAHGYKFPEGQDPRLTKIGAFIRKTSLDEFPQFINILKGDMSLIGPRPILAAELEEYTEREQKKLLSVKPGATGWWQVSGRSDVHYPERCELELYYPRNFSFGLDVKIFFLTIKQVFRGEGAH